MMPCFSGMDRKGSKPWPAGGVSTSMRYGRTTILIFRWARRSRTQTEGDGVGSALMRPIRNNMCLDACRVS